MSNPQASRIGVIHPGAMGVSVAASARNSRYTVNWASQGRSAETRARAQEHALTDVETLEHLCEESDIIFSICPPHAAEEVARAVIANGFQGLYCDANAISPQRTREIGAMLNAASIAFVDGSIIGGPAWKPGETVLYLSGERADEIATCFPVGPLVATGIGNEIGKASALKMCYAALTKGTSALLCAVLGAAEELEVRQELYSHWNREKTNGAADIEHRALSVIPKAWRFEGEMEEIASTFASVGMPVGFHLAAAEVYHRLAPLKSAQAPDMVALLTLLTREPAHE